METTVKKQTKKQKAIENLNTFYDCKTEEYKGATIITYVNKDKNVVAIFIGKGFRPIYYYAFKEETAMHNFVLERKKSIDADEARENEFKLKVDEQNKQIQAGCILVSSWGYEQTNIDFYKVVQRKNSFVTLQQIGEKRIYDNNFNDRGKTIADESVVIDKPFKRKLSNYGGVKISSFQYAGLWDKREMSWSSYA